MNEEIVNSPLFCSQQVLREFHSGKESFEKTFGKWEIKAVFQAFDIFFFWASPLSDKLRLRISDSFFPKVK